MESETGRFIELATRPLGDNLEMKLAAEAGLRKSIEVYAAGRPGALMEAVEAFEAADRHPQRRRRWIALLLTVTAVIFLPLVVHTILQFREISKLRGYASMSGPSEVTEPRIPGLTPQQRLILFGASGADDEAGKWKPLWDSAPDNPAYLAEYAAAYFRDHKELSPEILTAAESLDPDNAWFPALAASGIAEGAVTKERVPYSPVKSPPKTPVWKIDDAKRLDETLAAIHQLAGKTKYTAYQAELLRERMPLFPPRRDYVSQIPPMLYGGLMPTANLGLRKLSDALAAGAQQCAARGDVEGFRRITGDWQALVPLLVRGGDTLVDVMIAKVFFSGPAQNFRDAARTLGLEKETQYFAGIHDRWLEEKNEREKRGKSDPDGALVEQRSAMLVGMTLPMLRRQVTSPPRLTAEDLRPGRYADHALLGRLGSWAAFLLLGLCAAAATFRRAPLAYRLSARMVDLLRPADWIWMLLGGVGLPVAWYLLIALLTPLSAWEWSVRSTGFIQPAGQFGCLVLSMIVMTVQMAGWRLAKRGAVIGLTTRFPWIGWVAAAAALTGVPAFGAIMYIGMEAGYALAGIALGWMLLGAALSAFVRQGQALRRATLGRLVWPVWVCGMLVMAVSVPLHYLEERRWIQQDGIYSISGDFPGASRYEHDVTKVFRAELMEMIDQAGEL